MSLLIRWGRVLCIVAAVAVSPGRGQEMQFVTRLRDSLMVGGRPFYTLGANAYYLLERGGRGDTATVRRLFASAQALGFSVIRTWGFFDSADSLDPAVIQFRPGVYHESALRALDYVIASARQHDIRLIIPLVNSWDDYGGMNQYVRWRLDAGGRARPLGGEQYSQTDQTTFIGGARGQRFQKALSSTIGHDEFYTDSTICRWYQDYIAMIVQRVNTYTGVQYRNEPAILGWELANEPRSLDVTGERVARWVDEMSCHIKSLDSNHLIGSGEEGFDTSPGAYSAGSYGGQSWLFDGTEGVSFVKNSSMECIDFTSIHLYPESWNLTNAIGNVWIRDHRRISAALAKPLILGEFGVRDLKESTYESWLTTVLLEGVSGGAVWQLLEGPQSDGQGFGFRCPESVTLCSILSENAVRFRMKTETGTLPLPGTYVLLQNYPNPFNAQTTVVYDLPEPADVRLTIYDILGKKVGTVVEGIQTAGRRKELVNPGLVGTGTYFYFLSATSVSSSRHFQGSGKMVMVK